MRAVGIHATIQKMRVRALPVLFALAAVAGCRAHVAEKVDVCKGVIPGRGCLDKEVIQRVIWSHIMEVQVCYETELKNEPTLAGLLRVHFVISSSGPVGEASLKSSTMDSPKVEACIVAAVRGWTFPKPVGGGIVIVEYPFYFRNVTNQGADAGAGAGTGAAGAPATGSGAN